MNDVAHVRLFTLLLVMATPSVGVPQNLPESSFVVKLKYARIDRPPESSITCLAIFPDGRFHMEQSPDWSTLIFQDSLAPKVFEDSLPGDSLKSLSIILEAQELKDLRAADPLVFSNAEIVWAVIPRGAENQKLVSTALKASGKRMAKPFPASLGPLVEWFQATTTALKQRKLRPLKKSKPVNCWITQTVAPQSQ